MTGESNFEEVCLTMKENGIVDPKKLSEYEFYSALKFYHDRAEKTKSQNIVTKRQSHASQ